MTRIIVEKHLGKPVRVAAFKGGTDITAYNPNKLHRDATTGFEFYIRSELGKGLGVQVAEDFHVKKNHIVMYGAKPFQILGLVPQGCVEYGYGLFGGQRRVLFIRESGLLVPDECLMYVNYTTNANEVNSYLSSKADSATLRSPWSGTLKKGVFLNVKPYSTHGSLSVKGQKSLMVKHYEDRVRSTAANKAAGIGRIVCPKCNASLHRLRARRAHHLVCSKIL